MVSTSAAAPNEVVVDAGVDDACPAAWAGAASAARAQAAVAAALSPDHAALARRLFLYPKQEKRKVGVAPAQAHLRSSASTHPAAQQARLHASTWP